MADKQKILIVDDDNNIAELISLYLTKECFETLIVNDGESALTAFFRFKPDFFLFAGTLKSLNGLFDCSNNIKIRNVKNHSFIRNIVDCKEVIG